jgi:hypothetical protein
MFNRQTILKRREFAQGVADRLMAAEHAIDLAIARTAELTGFIPGGRADADLASPTSPAKWARKRSNMPRKASRRWSRRAPR